jgi:hypothetical protein
MIRSEGPPDRLEDARHCQIARVESYILMRRLACSLAFVNTRVCPKVEPSIVGSAYPEARRSPTSDQGSLGMPTGAVGIYGFTRA